MRRTALALAALLALPALAPAGMNRNYLVPVYEPCPGSSNCFPPVLSSSYTFDSIVLSSSNAPYSGPGKLALGITIKGLRDASGTAVTANVVLKVGRSRVTILTNGIGTLGETSPLSPETVYTVPVTNGKAKARFNTPPETPTSGLVVNSIDSPVLYDPEDKPLASTGTRTKN